MGDLQEGDGTNLGGGRSSSFLRFLGLGYHDDSRISHHVAGTYSDISGHFALDLESNSRRVPASQGGTIMGRN